MMKFKKILSLSIAAALILSLFCNIPAFVSAEPTSSDFTQENYYVDFSKYNFVEGTGDNGNVVKSESGKWSLVSDIGAVGGKYLHFEKSAVKAGENWKAYYHFAANPTGAYNAATSAGAVRLTENTRYTIKIKYKIENLDKAYDLDLYANCTKSVYSPNSFQTENINIAAGLGNTDGWVEKQYSFVTPASYEDDKNNLLIGFYPTTAGTASFPTNELFFYSLSIDYLEIEKTEFTPRHMKIDFNDYVIEKTTTSHIGSVNDDEYALWKTVNEDGSSNKIMQYKSVGKLEKDASLPYSFIANPTGAGSYKLRENAFVLENGADYRIGFRYRLTGVNGAITFRVGATNGYWSCNHWNGYDDYSSKVDAIALTALSGAAGSSLGTTSEWKEVSFTFNFPENRTGNKSLQVAFVPNYNLRNSETGYTFEVDDIVVDRLSAVTVVDQAGNKTVLKGAPAAPESDKTGFGGNQADEVPLTKYEGSVIPLKYFTDSNLSQQITGTKQFTAFNETLYSVKMGDMNADSNVNIADLVKIYNYANGSDADLNTAAADLNNDNKYDEKDLSLLRTVLLGI